MGYIVGQKLCNYANGECASFIPRSVCGVSYGGALGGLSCWRATVAAGRLPPMSVQAVSVASLLEDAVAILRAWIHGMDQEIRGAADGEWERGVGYVRVSEHRSREHSAVGGLPRAARVPLPR